VSPPDTELLGTNVRKNSTENFQQAPWLTLRGLPRILGHILGGGWSIPVSQLGLLLLMACVMWCTMQVAVIVGNTPPARRSCSRGRSCPLSLAGIPSRPSPLLAFRWRCQRSLAVLNLWEIVLRGAHPAARPAAPPHRSLPLLPSSLSLADKRTNWHPRRRSPPQLVLWRTLGQCESTWGAV
jgi:hypothetical protein